MKFTLGWLKDHLDTSASLNDISRTLTAIGLEVESVTDRAQTLKPFTVAKILEAEKHPEADKLRVCKVQSDAGVLQIVCGAANARAGIHVALAKEGAVIPANGMVIKKTKIRGVESNGMLCSAEELALAGDSEGIIELPESSKVGESVASVLGLDDPVIEIAITPNRADCLGVHGVARDLAAAGLGILKDAPSYATEAGCEQFWKSSAFAEFKSPIDVKIVVSGSECSRFTGYYIRNVKNGVSPNWMKSRLESIGQKSISVLVDITNYLMLDLGRPMHAYDADKVKGDIIVRNAEAGEKFKALNGEEYILDPSMVVIADNQGAIGLAGIIGGESTACTTDTKNIFLEVANFNPENITKTARKLDILSEARYRFERGVDSHTKIRINTVSQPIDRDVPAVTVYLINKYCGGTVSDLMDIIPDGGWSPRPIPFNLHNILKLGGVDVPLERTKKILISLGFGIEEAQLLWKVTPPSWRGDVEGEADLVEEVLRIHGYDNIPATPLPKLPVISKPALGTAQKRVHLAKRTLAGRGFLEVCTWSFLPEAQAKMFGGGNPALKLLNPINAELDTMRPNLLPNLLEAAKKNINRGNFDNCLFESGLQFTDIMPSGQCMVTAGIRTGLFIDIHYQKDIMNRYGRVLTAFDAKADALAVLQSLGITKCDITTNAPTWYHPGRSGALTLGGKIILGYFGELHPAIVKTFDISGSNVPAFEIFLDALPLPRAKGKARPALKISDYQAVERDFAFIVGESVSAADMVKSLSLADKQLITGIEIFDVYTGAGVEAGKKSVAVKVTLQAQDRTLSEQDISAASAAIITAANKAFGGQLRQ